MSGAGVDWNYLGQNARTPLITAAVVAVLLATSAWFANYESDRYARRSADQDLVNADYNALVVRKRIVDRYHRRYERFRQQGFVAAESRLDWIETLRESADDLKLPNLSYAIEPQSPVEPPIASTSNDVNARIFLSRLELDVDLVHEGDLLRVFDRLQQRAPGLLRIQGCTLSRRSRNEDLQSVDANIVASCDLDMFSVVTADVTTARVGL